MGVDFGVLLRRGFVLEAGLQVDLQSGRGAEQFRTVVTGHPVSFDQLLTVPLVNVELEVVVVQECHGAVGTLYFFFGSFYLLGHVLFLFPVTPGSIGIGLAPAACLMKLVPLGCYIFITGLAIQPVGCQNQLFV